MDVWKFKNITLMTVISVYCYLLYRMGDTITSIFLQFPVFTSYNWSTPILLQHLCILWTWWFDVYGVIEVMMKVSAKDCVYFTCVWVWCLMMMLCVYRDEKWQPGCTKKKKEENIFMLKNIYLFLNIVSINHLSFWHFIF